MRLCLLLCLLQLAGFSQEHAVQLISDHTNYNVGDTVRLRLQPATAGVIDIRYKGEEAPVVRGLLLNGSEYAGVWNVPADARTGRYQVDWTPTGGNKVQNATSFAVHRQLAKVLSVDLDKTFYTSGDSVNPTIVVRNVSAQRMDNLQVEFEPYTYPWIAPAQDDPPMWKHIVATGLTLAAGEEKIFHVNKAAVVQADNEPVAIYYSVVIRDSQKPDHIYDLAFALPAFTVPPNSPLPKQYPFLYLYWHLREVPKSESYRNFYPPEYVSASIHFDTSHTMFPVAVAPKIRYTVKMPKESSGLSLQTRVLDATGHEYTRKDEGPAADGEHEASMNALEPGLYRLQVVLRDAAGTAVDQNQLEFAVNKLPKSILIFCAHEDDDTAHPGIIRTAVENHIPIHFVYWTSGDAGGCDRFFMHSCDAERAMDFGEVRMDESRASLGHLGVPAENLFFLGLPDGGMGQVWDHRHASDPYLSVLLASEHAPYRDAAIPNLAYAHDAAVGAAKQYIRQFAPEMIITGHPDERHVDHRTNNWIVVEAMQELLKAGELSRNTELLVDVSYGEQPGKHAPYRYQKQKLYVSGEAAKLGQEATWYYQSQEGNHQQAEIKDFDQLPREEPYPHFRILDWWEHAGWNEMP